MKNIENFKVEGDLAKDGRIKFTRKEPVHGYLGGSYRMTEGEASEEEIALMKDTLVEEICNEIRKIAKERDDFFIIKVGARFPGVDEEIVTTVGAKFELPTVKADYGI